MKFRVLIALLFVTSSMVTSQTIPTSLQVESEEVSWFEDFETGSKTGYESGPVTCTMGRWTFNNAMIGKEVTDRKNGIQSVRMAVGGSINTLTAKQDGLGRLSFLHARYGSEGPATFRVQMRTTVIGLATFFDITEEISCNSTELEEYSLMVNHPGNIYIKITQLTGTKINIDDIRITPYEVPAISSWTSRFDGEWRKAINWYGGSPGMGTNVIIPGGTLLAELKDTATFNDLTIRPGGNMKLLYGKNLNLLGNLTLESDSTGMASLVSQGTLTIAGQTRIQLELSGLKGASKRPWWYVAVPLDNVTSTAFNLSEGVNKLSYYKEDNLPAPVYLQITDDSTELHPATGYVLYQGSRDSVFTFTGSLNSADLTIYPTRTGSTAAKRGFNLIGNPYTAYLDWNKVERYNVRPTIWLRTRSIGGDMVFDTYDGFVGTSNGAAGVVTNLIPPCQAFWTKVDNDNSTGVLSFDRLMLFNDSPTNPLRTKTSDLAAMEDIPLLRLRLTRGVNYDETILYINSKANSGFDAYDSPKMSNNNPLIPEIFTLASQEELVINHTGSLYRNQQIALGIRPSEEGVFMLSVNEILHFSKSTRIYLIDKELNKEIQFNQGSNYAFQSDGTASSDRFSLRFYSPDFPLDITYVEEQELKLWITDDGNIHIENLNLENMDIVVYNAAGQVLQSVMDVKNYIGRLPHAGVFFVRVLVAGKVSTHKIIAP